MKLSEIRKTEIRIFKKSSKVYIEEIGYFVYEDGEKIIPNNEARNPIIIFDDVSSSNNYVYDSKSVKRLLVSIFNY